MKDVTPRGEIQHLLSCAHSLDGVHPSLLSTMHCPGAIAREGDLGGIDLATELLIEGMKYREMKLKVDHIVLRCSVGSHIMHVSHPEHAGAYLSRVELRSRNR